MAQDIEITRLRRGDIARFREQMRLFSDVFGEPEIYAANPPEDAYVESLLDDPRFVSLIAVASGGDGIVGGLAAYELPKFEQERSEYYIYDLAVAESCRRQGIATALIREVARIARDRGAWVVFVQADRGDDAAIALYSKLGKPEEVLHFDLPVGDRRRYTPR
ncbi:MAG: AAC(3)-I family aminoglycoside N-acetyltransferase [Woeseiaceae bacterium]|nr:AAC(3)-I family aminoglycoside N-acetyltransferase [Woeseiaceae bacterium]